MKRKEGVEEGGEEVLGEERVGGKRVGVRVREIKRGEEGGVGEESEGWKA